VVQVLKGSFFMGLVLIVCFLMFIFAGAAGSDSEIVVGSIGFFGMIALLPLFLYLVIARPRIKQDEVEDTMVAAQKAEPMEETKVEQEVVPVGIPKGPEPPPKEPIDRNFIEDLRKEKLGTTHEEAPQIGIPQREEIEREKEIDSEKKKISKEDEEEHTNDIDFGK
jgi:hypothetical protein